MAPTRRPVRGGRGPSVGNILTLVQITNCLHEQLLNGVERSFKSAQRRFWIAKLGFDVVALHVFNEQFRGNVGGANGFWVPHTCFLHTLKVFDQKIRQCQI